MFSRRHVSVGKGVGKRSERTCLPRRNRSLSQSLSIFHSDGIGCGPDSFEALLVNYTGMGLIDHNDIIRIREVLESEARKCGMWERFGIGSIARFEVILRKR